MARGIAILLLTTTTLFFAPGFTRAASETSRNGNGVRFIGIKFDPNCRTEDSNYCRDKEFIEIRNDSDKARNLRGWIVHDLGQDHLYKIRIRTRLAPDDHMFLYSGKGDDAAGACSGGPCGTTYFYHWDQDDLVWDNDRDRATLKRPDGSIADRCGYGRAAKSPKRC